MNPRHLTICLLALTLVLPVGLSESLRTTDPELASATNATALELDGAITLQRNGSMIELVETNEPVAPNMAPAGLGGEDAWVDANGDTMFGDLVLDGADILVGDEAIRFTNGELRGTDDGTGLSYGGDRVCTEVLDIPGCGGLTEVSAGPGLLASGSPGSVTLRADYGQVQARVHGACEMTDVIQGIEQDGTVTCKQVRDTLDLLDCSAGQLAKVEGGGWSCAEDQDSPDADTVDGLHAAQFLRGDAPATFLGSEFRLNRTVLCDGCTPAALQEEGETLTVGPRGSGYDLALSPDDRPVISMVDGQAVALTICMDASCDAMRTAAVAGSGLDLMTALETTVAVRPDGIPVVAFYALVGAGDGLNLTACDTTDCSSWTTSPLLRDQGGVSPSIAVRGDGTPIIGYGNISGERLEVLDCHDSSCTSFTRRPIDTAVFGSGDVDLAIREDGTAILAYFDDLTSRMKVASCLDAACSSSIVSVHANAGPGGGHPSIAIRADGTAIISYLDTNTHSVNALDCQDLDCATATARIVAANPADGDGTSTGVGPDGNPIISFTEASYDDIKVAACDNPSCESARLYTLDTNGAGQSSLVVQSDGDPAVVYHQADSSNTRLTIGLPNGGTLVARSANGFKLLTTASGTVGAELPRGSGSWSSLSDRNTKTALDPVAPSTVLDEIAQLPLYEWQYKAQSSDVRHMGPMAQDFYAAFGLGEDERHISQVDADGVALAAIQGLVHELEERDGRIGELEARLATLEAAIHQLVETPEEAS